MNNISTKDPIISELSRSIVSRWISARGINLRVVDGLELERIITRSIPINNSGAKKVQIPDPDKETWNRKAYESKIKEEYEAKIKLIRIQERKACAEAISKVRKVYEEKIELLGTRVRKSGFEATPKMKAEPLTQSDEEKIELARMRERQFCVEKISNLREEPFIGFISKQQALNVCAYHDSGDKTFEP